MRRRRIAEKCIEEHGIVLLPAGIQKVTAISNRDVCFFRVEIEETPRHLNHGWVDFHDIDLFAFARELPRDDSGPHADAEDIEQIGGIALSEIAKHEGEKR